MPPDTQFHPRRVLLVDHDLEFVRGLATQLASRGYKVSMVTAPRDLFAALRDFNVPVAIVDTSVADAMGAQLLISAARRTA